MSLIFTCSLLGEDLVLACGNTSDVAEHLEFAVPAVPAVPDTGLFSGSAKRKNAAGAVENERPTHNFVGGGNCNPIKFDIVFWQHILTWE